MCEVMRTLTDGNLDIEVPYVHQGTEVGSMARKVAIFKQSALDKRQLEQAQKEHAIKAEEEKKQMLSNLAKEFESTILSVVEIIASAAGDMKANAENLSGISQKTSRQSASVAAAADQTSSNVQTVSAAVEELSASIGEINHQVSESARINSEAVTEVQTADTTISSLSDAAEQIGDVVRLIQAIAGQTNLLALNATIEAARAGEAGKGFAVVASEVKNLASQTANATEEISRKIATVQQVSTESVNAIRGIGKTIDQTNQIAGSISNAVQQQSMAVGEISRNVQQVSVGAGKIASSIMDVTQDASESQTASAEVLEDSTKLLQQAERLQTEIQHFLTKIRHS